MPEIPEPTTEPAPHTDDDRSAGGRAGMPAGRVFVVTVICLVVWGLLYAPELKRSSEAQPDGLRRTVSNTILGPVVWAEDRIGVTATVNAASRALGRDPNAAVGGSVGGIPVDIDQLPTVSPEPTPSGEPSQPVLVDTPLREPTPNDPLRVAVVGDSLAAGVGYFAERVFKPAFVNVIKQGRISTGLTRPDYFDWQAQMRYIMQKAQPDLTIMMVGENDQQSIRAPNGDVVTRIGTPAWGPAYRQQVQQFAETATQDGGHVVWIGLPNSSDTRRWPFVKFQNQIFQAVARQLPNVAYYDTWDAFAAKDGGYTAYFRDGGHVTLVRADDGVHFNSDGYTILMQQVAAFATTEFRLDPKTYGS
ncbi:MAG TPA: GDSL-type esterase/lipase family protein [Actinomycetota bacterium]|nr:GDSL-type esterase/lipase family protein [Actinomycetota bacterium]